MAPFHISLLESELQRRKERNSRYSLRAFASFLGIDPSALSRMLSYKQELSIPIALQVLARLKLSPEDEERFILSVAHEKYRQTLSALGDGLQNRELSEALRKSEAAFRASEKRLRLVFDTLTVALSIMDTDGKVILCNQKMRRFLPGGWMPSRDRTQTGRWRATMKDGRPVTADEFPGARALRGLETIPGLLMSFNEDGKEIETRVSARPIRDEAGTIVGAFVVIEELGAG